MNRSGAGSPISPEAAIRLLCAKGLLHARDLVDGEVSVRDVRGRNLNRRVDVAGGRGFFLKQVAPGESADPLRVEAWFYRCVAGPRGERLRPHVPRLALDDPARALIGLELIPDATTADVLVDEAAGAAMPAIGEPLGRALAACHEAFTSWRSGGPRAVRPWIFDAVAPAPAMMQYFAPAQVRLVGIVQQHDAAMHHFVALRRSWGATTLIHGDVKWSNLLVSDDATVGLGVRLIDWEFATRGDPAWDVGSVFHSFLVDCVVHAELVADTVRDAAAAFASVIPRAHTELRRFVSAYLAGRRLADTAADALLARAVLLAAVRLVQTAYESSEAVEEMPRFAAAELQLALNVFQRPAAARALLGLAPSPTAPE